jgi:ubiquinone/menaquinone biosynthesis C-methylase UbiE
MTTQQKSRFDLIGATYEEAISRFPTARTDEKWLLDKLRLQSGDVVLEFTAGSGYLTLMLAKKAGKVVAQDISPVMLKLSENKAKKAGISNISYYHDEDPGWSGLEPNSFDKAVCLGGFHHIPDQVRALQNAFRVLKPGGILVVGDFADCSQVQKYFDEEVHKHTDGGHRGLFLTTSRMINIGRICEFSEIAAEKTEVPFIFSSEQEIGLFYQLVHALRQTQEEALLDIKRYMGIKKEGNQLIVPMDYIYAFYRK